jgi:Sec-independent protein translocase protein TatA
MNIFGVGGWELLFIFMIMLVVAGPKRMAQWAYYLGRLTGQLRIMWGQMMETVQRELDESGVDVKLPKDLPTRRDIQRLGEKAFEPIRRPVQEAINEADAEMRQINETARNITRLDPPGQPNGQEPKPETPPGPEEESGEDFGSWTGSGFGNWSGPPNS